MKGWSKAEMVEALGVKLLLTKVCQAVGNIPIYGFASLIESC
jgi:hypothetical protein